MAFAIEKISYTLSGSSFYSGPYKSNTVYGYLNHTSLQGWWRLNTDVSSAGNVTDSSGNSRDGVFDADPADRPAYASTSGPSTYIQTVSNTFDAGDNAINIGIPALWDALIGNDVAGGSTQQMTFSAWVYKTGNGGSSVPRIIDIGGTSGEVTLFSESTDNLVFKTRWSGALTKWVTEDAIISRDKWIHVVITYDANSAENVPLFYVDGGLKSSTPDSTPSGTWAGIRTAAGYIGNNSGGIQCWEGNLADVAIWNTILSESQIKALYNASVIPGPFNVKRDYNVIGTKADPPFTGSYAAAVQGKNVNTYELFGTTVAPRMGRSDTSRFLLSSSAGVTDITPSNYDYFDDGVSMPQPISLLSVTSSASTEVLGDDSSRIIMLPQYKLSPTTFGVEEINTAQLPWAAMNEFNPVVYLTEPEQIAWPVVMGNPSPIDPYDFNGAIEPFALRKPIAGHSTFIGSIEDPEPTGVRAAVSSGQTQQVFYARSVGCSNFYSVKPEIPIPFEAVGCSDEYQEVDSAGTLTQWIKPLPYTTNITGSFPPFVEKLAPDQSFRNVSDFEMRNMLEEIFPGNQELGYPDVLSRSSACGFDYLHSRGIESIAFGGLIK